MKHEGMIQKLLGFLLLGLAILVAWHSLEDTVSSSRKEKPNTPLTFSEYVSNDLTNLKDHGALPKEWDQIQHVSYLLHSPFHQELMGNRKLSAIPESPSGKYKLEIEFIDVPDDENPGLILQMSMMDLQTNNKVWELGRTYALNPFLKKQDKLKENVSPAEIPPPEIPSKEKSKGSNQ